MDATTNDNVLYLAFAESSVYDTGAKPDLTAAAGAAGLRDIADSCYINTTAEYCLDRSKAAVTTIDVAEMDSAAPVITSATARTGQRHIYTMFSEPVWSGMDTPPCGNGGHLTAGDFTYDDMSGGNASAVVNVDLDTCGADDAFVILFTDAVFDNGDINTDMTGPSSGEIYDAANNAMSDGQKKTVSETTAPYLLGASTYVDADTPSYYIRLFYSEAVDFESAVTAAHYTISEDTATGCADVSASPLSVRMVSPAVYDLETETQCGPGAVLIHICIPVPPWKNRAGIICILQRVMGLIQQRYSDILIKPSITV